MSPRCLLVLLVAGLTFADPAPDHEAVNCTNIKPLAEVNIEQVQGEWLSLGLLYIVNGTCKVQWPSYENVTSTGNYSTFHLTPNANGTVILGKLVMLSGITRVSNMSVSPLEQGRWTYEYGISRLVFSVNPDHHLLMGGCDQGDNVLVGTLYSRRNPSTGAPVVSEEETEELKAYAYKVLGITDFIQALKS